MYKCFKCDLELTSEDPDFPFDDIHIGIVHDGLFFRATGNYGSTIFDPMDGRSFIEVVLCDKCIVDHQNKMRYWEHEDCRENNQLPFVLRDDMREFFDSKS